MSKHSILLIALIAFGLCGCVPQSKLDESNAKIALLEKENAEIKRTMTAEIISLKSEIAKLKEHLEAANATLAKKPQMPVLVTFRRALTGAGNVAMFNTTVKKDFPVLVTVTSKAIGTTKQIRLDLTSDSKKEIGHAEGIPITEGDTILIQNTNYEDMTVIYQQK